MTLVNPSVLYELSFQLSFLSVLGILTFYPFVVFGGAWRFPDAIKDAIAITVRFDAGVLPLIVYYFGYISLVTLPANMIIVPLSAPLLPLGLLQCALGAVHPAIALPLACVNWAIARMILASRRFLRKSLLHI